MTISIIVPIYNVELYIEKCLNSLAGQSFKDVEFIIIDDGSTDASGSIAEKYKNYDARFRVFHTLNNGLSAARNYGIEKAQGEWIMFVDGDDWVESQFCQKPYEAAICNNADIVVFRYHNQKNSLIKKQKNTHVVGIVDSETAVRYGETYIWNKLYKKELFRQVRFPEGKVHEDLAVTHRIILTAQRIVFISDYLYYYVYRKNSISNSVLIQNKIDGFVLSLQRSNDLKEVGYDTSLYAPDLYSNAIGLLIRAESSNDPIIRKAEEVVNSITSILDEISWKRKIMLVIWRIDKNLFDFICRLFGKKDTVSGSL